MKKITCIIPAHNEETGIGKTISIVLPLVGKYLHEVIVVDDGSTDKTGDILKQFPQIAIIHNEKNLGKSKSIARGINASGGDYIFLLDADLKFLNEKNILDMLYPIENDISDISISYIKNAWPLFPFKRIDYLSGERIIGKSYLMEGIDKMEMLSGYGLEVYINRIIIKNKLSIKVVHWSNVENTFSPEKRGIWKGIKITIKIWCDVLSTVSIFEMYYQNIAMIGQIVKD